MRNLHTNKMPKSISESDFEYIRVINHLFFLRKREAKIKGSESGVDSGLKKQHLAEIDAGLRKTGWWY